MNAKAKDAESEIINQIFDEIIKMLGQKQIKLESIIQMMIEQGTISQESFQRTYKILTEHAKEKHWI